MFPSILIISSCSSKKDDSTQISDEIKTIPPSYYLDNHRLISELLNTRDTIFKKEKANLGNKNTYAFDLYIRAGNSYKEIFEKNYINLRSYLFHSNKTDWFFLSGGYGIIHSLEEAKKYQATFNRSIAYQNSIPYTATMWKYVLPPICDALIGKLKPDWVYVFGSRDYTEFIKKTNFWREAENIKMFESTGSAGPFWLSPIINELVNSILNKKIEIFNQIYDRFIKQ